MTRFAANLSGFALLVACAAACASGPPPSSGPGRLEFGEAIERPIVDALVLMEFDANADRRITVAEMESRAGALFAIADANGDSVVGGIELRTFGAALGGSAEAAPLLVAMDRDGDGGVRLEEFTLYYGERLNGLDDDSNGSVSRAELVEEIAPPSRPRPQVVKEP